MKRVLMTALALALSGSMMAAGFTDVGGADRTVKNRKDSTGHGVRGMVLYDSAGNIINPATSNGPGGVAAVAVTTIAHTLVPTDPLPVRQSDGTGFYDGAAETTLQELTGTAAAQALETTLQELTGTAAALALESGGNLDAIAADLASLDSKIATLGQKAMAGSMPVTMASDQVAFPVNAVQSGTWNITNISGTISLMTGAATSALQTTGNSSLSSIDGKIFGDAFGQFMQLKANDGSAVYDTVQDTTVQFFKNAADSWVAFGNATYSARVVLEPRYTEGAQFALSVVTFTAGVINESVFFISPSAKSIVHLNNISDQPMKYFFSESQTPPDDLITRMFVLPAGGMIAFEDEMTYLHTAIPTSSPTTLTPVARLKYLEPLLTGDVIEP